VTQIGVAHSSFNKKGSNFVTRGQISEKMFLMRRQTIVLKFHGEEAGEWESAKTKKNRRRKNTVEHSQ